MSEIKSAINTSLSRRSFLVGSVGTGLFMGFGLLPGCSRDPESEAPAVAPSVARQVSERMFAPTVWFEMDQDGKTLVNIAKAEMGQHVGTALARVVAEELGVDWADVSIRHVDTDPKWGYMVTGGSWSVFTTFKQLSQAGAAGRIALTDAAAKMMSVAPADCVVENSRVSAGGQSLSFAEIVQQGEIEREFSAEELESLAVKPAAQRRLLAQPAAALDVPEKSTGQAVYGIDVERPGMLYGRPLLPPTRYGSVVNRVDESSAKQIPGYRGYEVIEDKSETLQGWVVALADDYWSAVKAAGALKVDWSPGATADVSEQAIMAEGRRLVANRSDGSLVVDEGDVDAARDSAAARMEATYTTASALHFTLEPVNAVAEYSDDKWHIYTGNQWQSLILPVLAKALEVAETDIVIHQHYLGGGFGRRLFGDYILPAALAAKARSTPVKVVFTREDDCRFDCPRSPSVQRLEATFDESGKLTGVEHAAAAGWPTLAMAPGFLGDGANDSGKFDPFSINGADHWYTIPAQRARAINNPLAQNTFLPGWLRAVGPGWTTWAVESFIDELAYRSGADPLAFRLALLDATGRNAGKAPESVGGASRLARVLEQLRDRSGWGLPLPAGKGRGVAAGAGQERTMPTWIGCVADVTADGESGEVTVDKLSLVIDCGTVVHPDGALAQAQGASLWGLSLALHEGTQIAAGQVADRNLDTYTPLRMADVPLLDIEFVDSGEFPVGLGEPPLSVVAPAVANAVFSATGARVRDLPITPAAVRAALA